MITDSRKGALFTSTNILGEVKATHKSHRERKSLQAYGYTGHISFLIFKALKCMKRASFRLSVTCAASISIEASIAIPVFLFCFLEILSLLNYLSVYSGVLYAMKTAAEPVAVYSYAYDELTGVDKEISLGEEVVTSLVFSEAYLDTQIHKMCAGNLYKNTVKGGTQGIHLLGSHVNQAQSCVDIIAYYSVKPMIPFAGTEMFIINRYYTKLWTGYKAEKTDGVGEYVYITESGRVYHLTENCTHLKLSISKVNAADLYTKRNESGGKYSECEMCCDNSTLQEVYYITDYGERYHETITCSGLKRTVYCVEKTEVGDRSVCSRCSQMAGEAK